MEKYTIKDVLFGLRTEYMEIEKALKTLEKQIKLVNSEDEIEFSISKESSKIDLKINLLRRQSAILKLIQKLGMNVTDDYEYRLPLHRPYTGGEHGLILSDSRFIELPEDANDFYALADSVISRPIVQTSPHYICIKEQDKEFNNMKKIDIYPLGVNVDAWEKHLDQPRVPSEFVSYIMTDDTINYSAYRDLALKCDLDELLRTPVNANELNKVEKDIIKKSNVLNKRVTVQDVSVLEENQRFNIEDTHDEIILRRK